MNKRLHALMERKKALVADSEGLLALIDSEDRDFTAEETTRFDANAKELEDLKAKITREESLSAYVTTTAASDFKPEKVTITNPRANFEDDPKKGFKSSTEFLTAVIAAGMGRTDDRLKFLATAGSDEQGGYSDPYGGYLIPEGLAPGVMSIGAEADPLAGRTTSVPMEFPSVTFNARVDKNHSTSVSGGLTVTRRQETQTGTSSRMSFEQVKLEAHSLFGLSYTSEEILERSPTSFAAMLQAGFADQFASHGINERLNGTGVGEPEGIMNSPALVSIAKESGQDADTIVYENLVKMRSQCWGYGNAVWLANHDTLPQLMSIVFPGTLGGYPIWQMSAREGEPDTLFGRPLIMTEYCQTIGDKGDIVLANWTQYLDGTYKPLRSAESMHVRFQNHERTFKFWIENDGRCWWRYALTPMNSLSTLSPFVTLDGR